MRREIRLAGSGGQGIQLAGVVLAEAAALDGFQVAQTQSYGPASRGGDSRSNVVINEEQIDYPELMEIDALLALTQEAHDSSIQLLKPTGILVVDTDVETNREATRVDVDLIAESVGRRVVSNMVALGALNQAASIVSWESLEEAIRKHVPGGTADVNTRALYAGKDAAKDP